MSEEIANLRNQIEFDELELKKLSILEAELLRDIDHRDYTAATKREGILSRIRIIEERVRKSRYILATLER